MSSPGGRTPSRDTGPNEGPSGGAYVYTEASGEYKKTAYLTSAWGRYTRVTFKFHMYGSSMGSVAVEVLKSNVWSEVWRRSGQQHGSHSAAWSTAQVPFDAPVDKVRFVGETGGAFRSDAALSDVRLFTAASGCGVLRGTGPTTGFSLLAAVAGTDSDAACSQACTDRTDCVFWVRQRGTGECRLSGEPATSAAADGDRDMGFRCDAGCVVLQGTGPTAGSTPLATVSGTDSDATCSQACTARTDCMLWVRDPKDGECRLSSTPATSAAADPGRTMGLRCDSERDYVAAFRATGCPNPSPGVSWWDTQPESVVLRDIYGLCTATRAGTASDAQLAQCCGRGSGRGCSIPSCEEQSVISAFAGCFWRAHSDRYSAGFADGVSTSFNLTGAKAKCLQLGPSACKAVTCAASGRCTVRGSVSLHPSSAQETTHVPSPACREGIAAYQATEWDFAQACPAPEYISGSVTDGADFKDYALAGAAAWSHVDWQYAAQWPTGALAFPAVPTNSGADVQRYEMALHVSTFAGVTKGATFTVVLDTTRPVCNGNPSAAVQPEYRSIVLRWFMEDPDSGMDHFAWTVRDHRDPAGPSWNGTTAAPTHTLTVPEGTFPTNAQLRLQVVGRNRAGLEADCGDVTFWVDHTPPEPYPGPAGGVLVGTELECWDRLSGGFKVTWEFALTDTHSGILDYFWALGTPADPEKYVARTAKGLAREATYEGAFTPELNRTTDACVPRMTAIMTTPGFVATHLQRGLTA